jgi:PAS domain-containing protein
MSHPARLELDWKEHVEAVPVASWIVHYSSKPDISQWERLSARERCGPVFANRACRELLGLAQGHSPSLALHPADTKACLSAWDDFLEGRSERFHQTFRWIRPDTKEIVTLIARAQRLRCGDIQGWLRPATAEDALSRLEGLTHG